MVYRKPLQHEIDRIYEHYRDTTHTPVGGVIFDVVFLIIVLCCLIKVITSEHWILFLILLVLVFVLVVLSSIAIYERKQLKNIREGNFDIAVISVKAIKFNGVLDRQSDILDVILVTSDGEELTGKLLCSDKIALGFFDAVEEFYVVRGLEFFEGQLVFLQVEEGKEDNGNE